jgi:hypothetical protein
MRKLAKEILVFNDDGTRNLGGSITEEVNLTMHFKNHKEQVICKVTELGKVPIIIRHIWLERHNPIIDWVKESLEMT